MTKIEKRQHFVAHVGEGRFAWMLGVGVKQWPWDLRAASLRERIKLPGDKTTEEEDEQQVCFHDIQKSVETVTESEFELHSRGNRLHNNERFKSGNPDSIFIFVPCLVAWPRAGSALRHEADGFQVDQKTVQFAGRPDDGALSAALKADRAQAVFAVVVPRAGALDRRK